jgi:hypothetical protein
MAQELSPELLNAVMQAESRGQRYDEKGRLLTSKKGAKGEMQVMDATNARPGFGVTPARDNSPDERARVGRDLLAALINRYPDRDTALMAYNWGPGNVDNWLKAGAPASKVPEETRNYVSKIDKMLMKDTKQAKAQTPAPTPDPATLEMNKAIDAGISAQAPGKMIPAAAVIASAPSTPNVVSRTAAYGPSYQAALAVSMLGDSDEKEDKDPEEPTEAEKFLAAGSEPTAAKALANLDLGYASPFAEPVSVKMAEGGEAMAEPQIIPSSPATRTFFDVLTGRRDPLTEKDFTPSEQAAMLEVIKNSEARGLSPKGRVDYGDYPSAESAGPGYKDIRNTLGGFGYERDPQGNVIISDKYDFHGPRVAEYEKMGGVEKAASAAKNALLEFLKQGGPRDLAGEIGRAYIGRQGPEVKIRIPPPVKRAKGSPEEGEVALTQEEIDAASRPAFITPSSGKGRKEGPISEALRSGEAYTAAARGISEMPYNLVGAPMDLAMLARQALTGQAPAGQVGTSEFIKKKATELGIRPAPPSDPTLRGFYDAADIASSLANPASVPRAAARGAAATGKAAADVMADFQQYNQQLAVPGASYAVRNRGTPFMMGYGRTEGPDGVFPAMDQAEKYIKQDVAVTGDAKLNDWLSNKLTAYLRRDFATPDDQFVKAADANQLLHFVNKPIPKRPDLDPYYERISNFDSVENLPYVRKTEGFEAKGEAKTEYGKRVETLTDASAWPLQLEDITSPGLVPPGMRDRVKTDPSARLTELGANVDEMLQFDKLAAGMEKMRSMPKIYSAYSQPGIKVPEEYLLTDQTLVGLTPAQASNRVAKFRNWEEENRQRMASKALFEDPSIRRTPAEGGGTWINPDDLAENPNMLNLIQDVGCDGGWCTKDADSALSYGSGENRLSILMDNKARPQAQLTITSKQYGADEFTQSMDLDDYNAFRARYPNIALYNSEAIFRTPEFKQFKAKNPDSFSITEIKGTNNRTDLTDAPYLKQIQKQIKDLDSQLNLQDVSDLDSIGMKQLPKEPMELLTMGVGYGVRLPLEKAFGSERAGLDAVRSEAIRLNNGSQYTTGNEDDVADLLRRALGNVLTPQQRATGGMIERQSTDTRKYL